MRENTVHSRRTRRLCPRSNYGRRRGPRVLRLMTMMKVCVCVCLFVCVLCLFVCVCVCVHSCGRSLYDSSADIMSLCRLFSPVPVAPVSHLSCRRFYICFCFFYIYLTSVWMTFTSLLLRAFCLGFRQ
ncbi:hypothetical protein NL108_013149 [Boleophthalmus pectinirostris]|nr:hypothetical protein NL108_013149 [Boleophthalmus pectinirostris]